MPGFKAATPQARASTHKVQPTPSRQNKEKKVHKLIKLKSVELDNYGYEQTKFIE